MTIKEKIQLNSLRRKYNEDDNKSRREGPTREISPFGGEPNVEGNVKPKTSRILQVAKDKPDATNKPALGKVSGTKELEL